MSEGKINFQAKRVLDLGCGHGLLGICALKLGANFCLFQDYNEDVLNKITAPNAELNGLHSKDSKGFMAGDWDNMH